MSVTVTGGPGNAKDAYLFSRLVGNSIWNFKGTFGFTGFGPAGIHTFNVANYASGSYEWSAWGDDTANVAAQSNTVGSYDTP